MVTNGYWRALPQLQKVGKMEGNENYREEAVMEESGRANENRKGGTKVATLLLE